MPALMMTLGATYVLRGPGGERRVPARDYYLGLYETAAKPGEVLAAIRVPKPPRWATAGPTRSSSARSATTRPPPRR